MKMDTEFRSIIEAEIPRRPLSPQARQRVEETYRILGAQRDASPKRRPRRAFGTAFAAVAACFLLLFGTNAAFPALAEELPVIGQWIKEFNDRSTFEKTIPQGKKIAGTNVADYGTESINAVSESGSYKMTVEEGFCDGKNMTISMRLEMPEEEAKQIEYALPSACSLSVNGADAGLKINDIILFSDGAGAYIGAVTKALPQKISGEEALHVSLALGDWGGKDKKNKNFNPCIPMDASFSFDFDLSLNLSYHKTFSCDAEDNGIRVINVESLPTTTTVTAVMSGKDWSEGCPALLLEDGTKEMRVNWNQVEIDGVKSSDITEEADVERIRNAEEVEVAMQFDGVPAGTEKVIFRQYKDERREEVKAEFTLDLTNSAAEASKTYEEGGSLDLDSPLRYEYLLAEFKVNLEDEANNGFAVSTLLYSTNDTNFTIGIDKLQGDYREIKAEVLTADNTVIAEVVSEYNTAVDGAKTYWDATSPNWDMYSEHNGGENAPNHYILTTPTKNYMPACGETLTVRVTDNQTKETILTQDIVMDQKG